jgi:Flp pilus assembly protein CpaB
MKKKTIFLISLLMAGLATILFYQYTNHLSQEAASVAQMKKVIAAAVPIKKEQQVTEGMLKTMEIPAKGVHPEAVLDTAQIIGKYATSDIAADEVILKNHLQTLEEADTVAGKLQQDDRAVTLPGGKIETVANMIEPEDTIDIIYTGPPLVLGATKVIDTVVLQENVRVLAVGRRIKTTDAYVDYDSITVEALPADALKLVKAVKNGTLNYVLHSKRISSGTEGEGS